MKYGILARCRAFRTISDGRILTTNIVMANGEASMPTQFSWIPFYEQVADKLVGWENRQGELIAFLKRVSEQGLPVTKLQDQDEQGNKLLLEEIDPFTFMGAFNRGITDENRRAIASAVKEFLGVQVTTPGDFSGIPILNNQSSWFFSYKPKRQ